jgi:hypothetical protein
MSDPKNTPDAIATKVVDLIGPAALAKLQRHGFSMVSEAEVKRFLEEHKKSNARIRETAAAAMRAIGIHAVRVESEEDARGGVRFIFTAPSYDEPRMAETIVRELQARWYPPAETKPATTPLTDTNDVPMVAAPLGDRLDLPELQTLQAALDEARDFYVTAGAGYEAQATAHTIAAQRFLDADLRTEVLAGAMSEYVVARENNYCAAGPVDRFLALILALLRLDLAVGGRGVER